jgi:hypothetical protein
LTWFKVTGGQSEAGYVKYVTWNDPVVSGTGQSFSRMKANKVRVIDVEESDGKGISFTEVDTVQVIQNISSVPVTVYVWPSPAKLVKVTLEADTSINTAEGNDPDKTIELSDKQLSFVPWDDMGHEFNLTVAGYDTTLGKEFRVNFGYDGDNADSYMDYSGNYITFEVIDATDLANPSVTLDDSSAIAYQW